MGFLQNLFKQKKVDPRIYKLAIIPTREIPSKMTFLMQFINDQSNPVTNQPKGKTSCYSNQHRFDRLYRTVDKTDFEIHISIATFRGKNFRTESCESAVVGANGFLIIVTYSLTHLIYRFVIRLTT